MHKITHARPLTWELLGNTKTDIHVYRDLKQKMHRNAPEKNVNWIIKSGLHLAAQLIAKLNVILSFFFC